MKYPLEFLLGLRKTRMEKCEQALAQARALVRKRNQELEDRISEHREYVEWCDREEDRIFEELIKKPSTHHKVLESREEKLANRAKEAEYLHRIEEARAALKAAHDEEAKCLAELQVAIRNREKLASHKSHWTEAAQKEEQMAEDLVMEETAESAYLRNMQPV